MRVQHANHYTMKTPIKLNKKITVFIFSVSDRGTTCYSIPQVIFKILMSRAFGICGWFFWGPPFHKIRLGRTVILERDIYTIISKSIRHYNNSFGKAGKFFKKKSESLRVCSSSPSMCLVRVRCLFYGVPNRIYGQRILLLIT